MFFIKNFCQDENTNEAFVENYLTTDDQQADAFLVYQKNLEMDVFPEKLKAIAYAGEVTNLMPLKNYTEQGIVVFNTPDARANAVKELTFAMLLMASRHLFDLQSFEKSGTELKGKTLGVIGLDAVGTLVANQAVRFGMKVISYDPEVSVESAWEIDRGVKRVVSLEELLISADYITLNVPKIITTEHLITKTALEKMKDNVVLINFSNKKSVNEQAIKEAVLNKKVSYYIVDEENNSFSNVKNIITVPNIVMHTEETYLLSKKQANQKLIYFLKTGNIIDAINLPTVNLTFRSPTRLAIMHYNITNMIGQMSTGLAHFGINIENIMTKGKEKYAYTVIDILEQSDGLLENVVEHIKKVEGIISVRVIKNENLDSF